jgi:predicted nucleic acid-binding protein
MLETAIAGHADWLVTGDADLLELNPFRGLSIVTPAEILEAIV